jgi:hypothetical protein
MKIALCTTTIHVPHALKLLQRCDPAVKIFVAFDEKTPVEAIDFCTELPFTKSVTSGVTRWKCSDAIGWNTIARRNIAFLEALKWGADVIYSWDDDNLPIDTQHYDHIRNILRPPVWSGIEVTGAEVFRDTGHGSVTSDRWFDPGRLLIPATRHRGFPHARHLSVHASSAADVRVGVAAGLIIGDPDIDATTRMEVRPDIGAVHVLGQAGVVVQRDTWTIWNSQNTAIVRELIPAWFMMPGVGRHDDIYASLIVQRVARERGYHVHFGQPFCYQQRNEHDLMVDLRAEIDGMENVEKIASALDAFRLMPGASVIGHTRALYIYLASEYLIPDQAFAAAMAWLEDCEGVL